MAPFAMTIRNAVTYSWNMRVLGGGRGNDGGGSLRGIWFPPNNGLFLILQSIMYDLRGRVRGRTQVATCGLIYYSVYFWSPGPK